MLFNAAPKTTVWSNVQQMLSQNIGHFALSEHIRLSKTTAIIWVTGLLHRAFAPFARPPFYSTVFFLLLARYVP